MGCDRSSVRDQDVQDAADTTRSEDGRAAEGTTVWAADADVSRGDDASSDETRQRRAFA